MKYYVIKVIAKRSSDLEAKPKVTIYGKNQEKISIGPDGKPYKWMLKEKAFKTKKGLETGLTEAKKIFEVMNQRNAGWKYTVKYVAVELED